jgi:hypothetical protein
MEKFQHTVALAKGGAQKALKKLDFRFRGNDTKGLKRNFSEPIRNSFSKIRRGGSHG